MDLGDHFRVIAHSWWRILLVALLVGAGVYFMSNRRAKVYEASTQLSVTPAQQGSFPVTRDETLFLTDTYAERATTRPVLKRALNDNRYPELKQRLGVFDAMNDVTAEVSGDVGFLELKAKGPTPRESANLATAAASALIADVAAQQDAQQEKDLQVIDKQIQQVAAQLGNTAAGSTEQQALQSRLNALNTAASDRLAQPKNSVDLVSDAAPPSSPASPRPLRDSLLGFLVALVLASELSVGIEAVSDRLPRSEDPEAISKLFGLPVLAMLPRGSDDDRVVVEAFRTLRTSLASLPPEYRPHTLAIASSHQGAGKSF